MHCAFSGPRTASAEAASKVTGSLKCLPVHFEQVFPCAGTRVQRVALVLDSLVR